MANYVDQWLQIVVNQLEGKNWNMRAPISGKVMPYGIHLFGGDHLTSRSLYTQYANNLGKIKSQLSRGLTDAERNSYMRDYEQAINDVWDFKNEYLPYWQAEDQKKQQQEALQKQQEELARQKAEQERLREQQAALERQRQEVAAAAEKARKESEFKSALEAMNQRAMPRKGTEEFIGAVEEDPQDSAKKKKRRVGYDATKSTGVLGIPQTERKQLLGM